MAKDPYRYFRIEARELVDGLVDGVVQLEKHSVEPDVVSRLLRLAHTLKGAARVVKQPEIAQRAHAVEELLVAHRESGVRLDSTAGNALLRLLDEISTCLMRLEPEASREPAAAAAPKEEAFDTLRVDITEMDELVRGAAELSVHMGAVHRSVAATQQNRELTAQLVAHLSMRSGSALVGDAATIARARSLAQELGDRLERLSRNLATDVERVTSELGELQGVAHRLRLTSAHTVFAGLERVARDAALALGKPVSFEATGGDARLDAGMLIALRDALAHIVRNAIAHGIEAPSRRLAAGKLPLGSVRLHVERRGSRVAFSCTDDGGGVDVEAVRRAAVASGRATAAQAASLSRDEVVGLLLTGGLSTSARVTELSGRGIGLDVARATALRVKGTVQIRSEAERGTTIELLVPVSIASMQGLMVEVAGRLVSIPLEAIRKTMRVDDTEIVRTVERESILHEGSFIPFLPLERVLGRGRSGNRRRRMWSVVVIQSGDQSVAIGVDRLRGTANVVMRSLPSIVDADAVIAGASLDADGNPQLVLDALGLIDSVGTLRSAESDATTGARAPILVIDDSLTTRMLEQSILQSAGYEVALAVSAEDGMEQARRARHSLFIVDVEMPGMDGFEFVTRTRADAVLRDTPAILVTSRNEPGDRRRGEEAGASAYIVKGEFDQDLLLRTIRQLVR